MNERIFGLQKAVNYSEDFPRASESFLDEEKTKKMIAGAWNKVQKQQSLHFFVWDVSKLITMKDP